MKFKYEKLTYPEAPSFPAFLNQTDGLTKREFFAALAMQSLLTDPEVTLFEGPKLAVTWADALIEELNKTLTKAEKPE